MPNRDDRRRTNNEEWERRGDRLYDDATRKPVRTGLKVVIGLCLVAVALTAIFGVFGFVTEWGSQPKRIYGVENVRKTWDAAYKLDRGLQAQARIVCRTAQTQGLADTVSGSALLAVQSVYDKMQASYSELISNKLEGGLVMPPNLHSKDKTLEERMAEPDVHCPKKVIDAMNGAIPEDGG